MAYVPQEAWIQNMTLRDNILFGRDYNHSRYWKVIDNCSLKTDLALLDGGDKTEIGEKVTIIQYRIFIVPVVLIQLFIIMPVQVLACNIYMYFLSVLCLIWCTTFYGFV